MAVSHKQLSSFIDKLTRALGPPSATPEWTSTPDGVQYATYRVWRWDCPLCAAGEKDPQGMYRPMSIDSNGNMLCNACGAGWHELTEEIVHRLRFINLVERSEARLRAVA